MAIRSSPAFFVCRCVCLLTLVCVCAILLLLFSVLPENAPVPKSLSDVVANGLVALCKATPRPTGLDAIRWLGNWLLTHNPNAPSIQAASQVSTLRKHADARSSYTTYALPHVVLLWDACCRFRALLSRKGLWWTVTA